jgi:glycine dehydrogenase subunit 2
LPGLSEPQIVRHYTRLSQKNYAIDMGLYTLGSCTMKHNPRLNERAVRMPGLADLHPLQPIRTVQGALQLMEQVSHWLKTLTGMPAVALSPGAGAHGELCGMMAIRAALDDRGDKRRRVLVPESAHGTNPATAVACGFTVDPIPADPSGRVDLAAFREKLGPDVAAIMLTNPNTVGLFESHLPRIASMVHDRGGLVYGDGANLNAIMGRARPGDLGIDVMQFNLHKTFTTPHGGGGPGCGPVGYKRLLAPYAPIPVVEKNEDGSYRLDVDRPSSVGRVRSFVGNFGMMVRAYTYIREMGAEGLSMASDLAVLNANYLRVCLGETWHVAFDETCMHEVVVSDRHLRATGVTTMDVAKRLIDYGFHPPTVYFPLVVKGAMLIEPTETETKQALDEFVSALSNISREANEDAQMVKGAPHLTRLRRLDETRAARSPVLRWTPAK